MNLLFGNQELRNISRVMHIKSWWINNNEKLHFQKITSFILILEAILFKYLSCNRLWIEFVICKQMSWEIYLKLYSQKIDQLIIMKNYKNFQKITSFILTSELIFFKYLNQNCFAKKLGYVQNR